MADEVMAEGDGVSAGSGIRGGLGVGGFESAEGIGEVVDGVRESVPAGFGNKEGVGAIMG